MSDRQRLLRDFIIQLKVSLPASPQNIMQRNLTAIVSFLTEKLNLPTATVRYAAMNLIYGLEVAVKVMAEFRKNLLSPVVLCGICGVMVSHTFTHLNKIKYTTTSCLKENIRQTKNKNIKLERLGLKVDTSKQDHYFFAICQLCTKKPLP